MIEQYYSTMFIQIAFIFPEINIEHVTKNFKTLSNNPSPSQINHRIYT